ncbi:MULTISPECIES: efflux RND transporter periplasmic adaptor subunit [unclassified Bradyrhizobium]|uniref:efflux RND transporter periplasmic adaptor subunit n=1 Tax=unclassified Bradyrhizobium TaxID=2631580 RepID=UPI001FFC0773|nr:MULTISPECIES: efflux RND transporter periplasmic adaptor subunit [unclassified Bradyrhizobium]MCK1711518.1 efflux RND transporter periplasmic adaptor subunit [Bradyrhizobium sp. 143]MCK1731164.1 efflux RND transporter periplasmic adaptor subunit [Bradyrhizobium sp. 142]
MQRHYRSLKLVGFLTILSISGASGEERRVASQEKLDCLIESSATLKIGAPVPGLIRNVLVDRGDVVRQGQRLAELESEVEEAAVAAARSRSENDNPISSGEARVEFLHRKFKRMETLRATNTVTEAAYDEAKTDERVAILALKEAQLNLDIAKSELRRAEGLLRQRVILSPLDAVVTERVLGPGEYRTEQAHILVLARMNPLYVEVFAPLAMFGQLRPGMIADVEPEAPVGGHYRAAVTVVDTLFDASSGTFGVRLSLPNPDLSLPGGLRCKIRFLDQAGALGEAPR